MLKTMLMNIIYSSGIPERVAAERFINFNNSNDLNKLNNLNALNQFSHLSRGEDGTPYRTPPPPIFLFSHFQMFQYFPAFDWIFLYITAPSAEASTTAYHCIAAQTHRLHDLLVL